MGRGGALLGVRSFLRDGEGKTRVNIRCKDFREG